MSFQLSSLLRSQFGRLGALFAATVALAGCGGSVVDPFEPARIVSLGDEYSYIASDGRKYTVHQANDCNANRLWNQQLVESFGFSFPQCNWNNRDASRLAVLAAQEGARAGDIAAQIPADAGARDLVLLLAGANDIWDAYLGAPAAAETAVDTAATTVFERVRDLVNRGSKVLVLTVPDQGMTPSGQDLGAAEAARLSALTERFNETLRNRLNTPGSPTATGRNVGLVLAQGVVLQMQNNPGDYGLNNVRNRACGAFPALDCTAATAVPDYDRYLYADGRYLSTRANARIGVEAEARARGNPFTN